MLPKRRRQKRRHLIFYLDVFRAGTDEIVGHLGDVTAEGLLLLDHGALAVGDALDLAIAMPEAAGFDGRLHVRATVRWIGADRNPAIACAGCSFDPVSTDDRTELDRLIRLLGFEDTDG
jgi:hypothetical protein